jgi:hypothetical protein
MLAQGTPLHVVSDVLEHASIAITKDVAAREPNRISSSGRVVPIGSSWTVARERSFRNGAVLY